MENAFQIARGREPLYLLGRMANRHGLITGATGTGKTVTLRVIAEGLSRLGVPVFMADVKGDLAGMSQTGGDERMAARARELEAADFSFQPFPVRFWDVFGAAGHPFRTTISEIGPLLLGRILDLNEIQCGVLELVFKLADDKGWLLLDLKDLQAMLAHAAEHAGEYKAAYGNISGATVGAIQRGLLSLERQGGECFFGEPAVSLEHLLQTDGAGQGVISILSADKLIANPRAYSTLLLWLLAELYETLPEVGDREQPKLAFFFDEAHLLFDEASGALRQKVEQVVRLVRSKGVGVYFVTQNPLDLPDNVLGQLGNRVQHALRAYTPREQKAVRAAAEAFRTDGRFDVAEVISQLEVGEALVSLLDEKGAPGFVDRARILPPRSRLGSISAEERSRVVQGAPLFGHYERALDRESAYEVLQRRAESEWSVKVPPAPRAPAPRESAPRRSPGRTRQSPLEALATSTARSVGYQLGRRIARGILGSLVR